VVYAPRGFPFGREFGHKVLSAVYGAIEALRAGGYPRLRLVLLAVNDPATELRGVEGVPGELPAWVEVNGVVTPAESLLHARAADVLVGEGTSTMHEGAALRTPLVLVPGTIQEAMLLGVRMGERKAAHVFKVPGVEPLVGAAAIAAISTGLPKVSAEALADAFSSVLSGPERLAGMTDRAHALVTGGGGVEAAARVVLDAARRHAEVARRVAA
jgi:UDP-N-acetylglucosamine:LPS N-acetylglucosamine transferase